MRFSQENEFIEFGTFKIAFKFAWWPTSVQNKVVWLETYRVYLQYGGGAFGWENLYEYRSLIEKD